MVKVNSRKVIIERARQGLTIGDMAKKSGLARHTIKRIEDGFETRVDTIGKIALALNLPIEELLAS